jgi:hypothetical protein
MSGTDQEPSTLLRRKPPTEPHRVDPDRPGLSVFKTGEAGNPGLAGSIPVRLR